LRSTQRKHRHRLSLRAIDSARPLMELLPQHRACFVFKREKRDGTKIFEEGISQSRTRDEETQARHSAQRRVRQEGHKPKAGDRDWFVGGKARRKESPSEEECEKEFEEIFQEEQQEEVGTQVEAIRPAPKSESHPVGHPHLASIS
jgi:hypothetical protein